MNFYCAAKQIETIELPISQQQRILSNLMDEHAAAPPGLVGEGSGDISSMPLMISFIRFHV